jgi:hypothetical protein
VKRGYLLGLLGGALAVAALVVVPAVAHDGMSFPSGGGGGGDAATLDTYDSTDFVRFGLCSTVDDICVNVSGKDYTAASGTELRIGPSGDGAFVLEGPTVGGVTTFGLSDDGGSTRASIFMQAAGWLISQADPSIAGKVMGTSAGGFIGISGDAAATLLVGGFADGIGSDLSRTDLVQVYGEGLMLDVKAQTCNCGTAGTPNTVTCTIGSGTIILTDGDADACTVTLATATLDSIDTALTPEIYSRPIRIVVDSLGGGGAFNIADNGGVVELDAAAGAWAGTTVGSTLTLMYAGGNVDAFLEESRSIK